MRIIERGTVFDGAAQPPHRRFSCFTSPIVLSDGRWLVAFRAGSSKDSADENVLIRLSSDEGMHWETVFEGLESAVDGVPGGWRHGALSEPTPGRLLGYFCWFDRSDPSRPLANPETQGVLPSRVFLMESTDGGRVWHEAREVDTRPYEGIATTGPVLKLKDGRLAIHYEAWKAYDDPRPGEHHAILRVTHDGAYTFGPAQIVAHDPGANLYYWDQRIDVEPHTGRLIAMFWTHDRTAGQDVNVHVAWGSPDGTIWSDPQDVGFGGQICSPLALGGGRVLAVYVHRHHPPSLRAVLSDDFGKTWDINSELVFYESHSGRESGIGAKRDFGDYWADMSVWSFGHAEPRRLPNEDVLVAYYAGDASAMGIHWVRIGL